MEENKTIIINGEEYEEEFSAEDIDKKINEIAYQISSYLDELMKNDIVQPAPQRKLMVMYMLGGGVFVGCHLSITLERIGILHEIEYIYLQSYGIEEKAGELKEIFLPDPEFDYSGYDIIIGEDIIDKGLTGKFIYTYFTQRVAHPPKTLSFFSLLAKEGHEELPFKKMFIGFTIDAAWRIGKGLDARKLHRAKLDIYKKKG